MEKLYSSIKRILYAKALLPLFVFLIASLSSNAQITVADNQTAAALASALAGGGVTIISPTLICNPSANGKFTTGAISPLGIPFGIVLSSGSTIDTTISGTTFIGISHPASMFADGAMLTDYHDADLAALESTPTSNTHDACVLQFDFKAAGDTIKFDYVFGSEEYPEWACTGFNDVFGFLISGGVTSPLTSYPTPYNIARVPGTTIPVCINSVTCESGASCTAMGPGSPFCAYYIDNSASTTLVYDGMTVVLQAIAAVSPCDTYHLKLGVADVGDDAYDSGVFIRGGEPYFYSAYCNFRFRYWWLALLRTRLPSRAVCFLYSNSAGYRGAHTLYDYRNSCKRT